MKGGPYRPAYVHTMKAGLDADGSIIAWEHHIVGQSIMKGGPFEAMMQDGIDPTSVEGAQVLPYAIPNRTVGLTTTEVGVPVLWWRAVGSTHTAFAVETFLDELAAAAGQDPLDFRLAMLGASPRHAGVLRLAAEKAGWGTPPPEGRSRGIALAESFSTFVAETVEVSMSDAGPIVHRVVCAVDCGIAINPDTVRRWRGRSASASARRWPRRSRLKAARSFRPTTTPTLHCGSRRCRLSRSISCPPPNAPPALANPACRPSARWSQTPSARPPANR